MNAWNLSAKRQIWHVDAPVRSNGLRTVWWLAELPMGSFTLNYSTMKYSSAGCRENDRGKRNIFALSKLCGEAVAHRSVLSPLIYVNRPWITLSIHCLPQWRPEHFVPLWCHTHRRLPGCVSMGAFVRI